MLLVNFSLHLPSVSSTLVLCPRACILVARVLIEAYFPRPGPSRVADEGNGASVGVFFKSDGVRTLTTSFS